jgi:hypothetical protein
LVPRGFLDPDWCRNSMWAAARAVIVKGNIK